MELEYLQIVLPSDKTWRTLNYYKLVEKQRILNAAVNQMPPVEWEAKSSVSEESDAKRPRRSRSHQYGSCDVQYIRRSTQSSGGLVWSSTDIALSARLFASTNARNPAVAFVDEEEKRRVFTLVYDVLRYKSVLNRALTDLNFFTKHPQLKSRCYHVWLLFFDLYKRDFTPRDVLNPQVDSEFQEQGLFEIDAALWNIRVRLAATVSRLRIKHGAHSLSMLLPIHLQQTKSTIDQTIITGWVNGFRNSLNEVCKSIESISISPLPREEENLYPMTYKTDHLLPRFLHIMPAYREDVVHLPIILSHNLILQERTFCIGPAVMAQLLNDFALTGIVAQTHVNSMVTMAYFANLLVNNDKVEMLHVFGAGNKKNACIQYLQELGVKNTEVHEENFADLSPDNHVLNNVIGVLATPPNTNSSVVDPVDLAVARGGDLELLQQLTEEDFSSTPSGKNIDHLLIEQRETLRRAMSKPQIQFVVYETHSRFDCENSEMTNILIEELNTYARDAHLEELRKSQGEKQPEQSEKADGDQSVEPLAVKVMEPEDVPLPPSPTIVVPPSDLFELGTLPDLCPGEEKCLDLQSEGIYLAVIKRKEITRLDPKYMIQMAEARGLFGRSEGSKPKQPSGQSLRTKAALAALQNRPDSGTDSKRGGSKMKIEVDRIAAPTRSSFLKDSRTPIHVDDPCPRHANHLSQDGKPKGHHGEFRIDRKTPLTSSEEEELIMRLYNSHRISGKSKLPPNDPLPPLKFWESPAQEIEDYIKKQVFKKRMQKAIEINRMNCVSDKDYCPHDSSVMALDAEELLSELRKFPEAHSEMDLLCRRISSSHISTEITDKTIPDDKDKRSNNKLLITLVQSKLTQTQPNEESIDFVEETTKVKQRLLESQDSFIISTKNINSNKTTSNFTQTNFIPRKGRVSFQSKRLVAKNPNYFNEN